MPKRKAQKKMNVNLLFREKSLKKIELESEHLDLIQDLGLDVIVNAMADGDEFINELCTQVFIQPISDANEILYRQEIAKDALKNIEIFKKLYQLSIDVLESKKKSLFWMMNRKPSGILFSNVRMMENLLGFLSKLRELAENTSNISSAGMNAFFKRIREDLDHEYLEELQLFLKILEFRNGMTFSSKLGEAIRCSDFVLRYRQQEKSSLFKIFSKDKGYSFTIDERDEAGFRALSEIKDKALFSTAITIHNAVSSILKFFETIREETAFYIGAFNLYKTITNRNYPICFPKIRDPFNKSFENLVDLSLLLVSKGNVVGNIVSLNNKKATFIVGANQGGKTTFLRSVGIAQIMFQSGLFVPAQSFESHINDGIFSHFKREEDITLKSGKLDDELKRMNRIAQKLKSSSLVLMNESFASTNEQEGSDIAEQIVSAFTENDIEVFYVTHMYTLAKSFLRKKGIEFLVAEVDTNGKRTFKVKPGEPQSTSFGKDLFKKIFSKAN